MIRRPSLLTLLLLGSASLVAPTASAQQDTPPAPQPAADVPSMQEAGALLQQQDWQAASVAYARIVIDQPENGQAWQLLGYSLHANGDLDRALRVHQKAATFPAVRPVALYNVACVHSLQGRTDEAFDYLRQAMAAGFNDPNQYGSDPDLRSLHSDPRWEELGRKLRGEEMEEVVEEPIVKDVEVVDAGAKKKRGQALSLAGMPAEKRFDFWIGEWDVYLGDEKVTEWSVKKELEGKVIRQTGPYSMTVVNFEPNSKKWHMTWMSTEGHHDVLTGGLEGEALVMHQKVVREAPGSIGRWILSDVHKNYFSADWQLSADKGKTWSSESQMTFWRKGAAVQASAPASQAAQNRYDFLVGEFEVEFKAMTPDQNWVTGKGVSKAKRKDDGSIVETTKLTMEDGNVWEGITARKADSASGHFSVVWEAMDGSARMESKSAREGDKVVEISVGEDQYGAFRDKLYFTDVTDAGYSVWLDRVYTESGTTIEGLYRGTYRRVK